MEWIARFRWVMTKSDEHNDNYNDSDKLKLPHLENPCSASIVEWGPTGPSLSSVNVGPVLKQHFDHSVMPLPTNPRFIVATGGGDNATM